MENLSRKARYRYVSIIFGMLRKGSYTRHRHKYIKASTYI